MDRPAQGAGAPAAARVVHTLVGHAQLPVGLRCLPTLPRLSREPLTLLVHDDGTLTPQDAERLRAALPGGSVLWRADADARVTPLLAGHPRCRRFRERHPLALKLLDVALLEADDVAYCDSDVLFVHPFTGLFRWPDAGTGAMLMHDVQDAYALYPWHAAPLGPVRLLRRANSGLVHLRAGRFDLDFVEWLLGRPRLQAVFARRAHWVEQTCWAALAWRVRGHLWDGEQIRVATVAMRPAARGTVAIHFVASARGMLDAVADASTAGAPAVTVRSAPARATSALRLLGRELAFRLPRM